MDDTRVLAVVGMAGSGKSAVADALARERRAEAVYFGGVVIDEILRRGLQVNEETEAFVRRELRQVHGMAAMAKLRLPAIELLLQSNKPVMIDGLYSYSEYIFLKDRLADRLLVIAVHSSLQTRIKRLAERQVRPLTEDEVFARDRREIEELEKGGPIALADYHIVNDGTEQELMTALARLNLRIQSEGS